LVACQTGLETCGNCGSGLVEAEAWSRLARDVWWFRLVCHDCGAAEELLAERALVETFERHLEAARADMSGEAEAWSRRQMTDWAYRFRTALDAGAVLPMDFG
jgi:hypothetical protein